MNPGNSPAIPGTDRTIRRVVVIFLAVACVQVLVGVVAVRSLRSSREASDWVNHTNALIQEVDGAGASFQAAEGRLRTYAVTGAAADLVAARESLAAVDEHLAVAEALTRSDPEQQEQIAALADLAGRLATAAGTLINLRQNGDAVAASEQLAGEPWVGGPPELARQVAEFRAGQMELLAERDTLEYRQARRTQWTVWVGIGLNVVILAGVVWLIRDDNAARQRAATALADANRDLEQKVQERTAVLQAANEKLVSENRERHWAGLAIEHQLRYNQEIIDSISDQVYVLTKARNISRINSAVAHATGWKEDEILNRPLAEFFRIESAGSSAVTDPVEQAMREGRELRKLPGSLKLRGGEWKLVRFNLYPLRDGNTIVGGIVIVSVPAASASAG